MANVLTRSRSPGIRNVRTLVPSGVATAITMVPTGCSCGSGPAEPVRPRATSAPSTERAPSAIATPTGSLTTPWAAIMSAGTPSSDSFTSVAYATIEPRNVRLEPGTDVIRPATRPPVADSAMPSVQPRSSSALSTTTSIVSPSAPKTSVPSRSRIVASTGAMSSIASTWVAALAVIRTLISPPEARNAIVGFDDAS